MTEETFVYSDGDTPSGISVNRHRTIQEMARGSNYVELYNKLLDVEIKTNKLKRSFPTLNLGTVVNKPYTTVTLRATVRVNDHEEEFEEELDVYPSDHLIAQLAIIS